MSDHLTPLPDPDSESLPLLDLFLRLQALDLPLGIGEYRTFLRAVQLGFGQGGDDELKWLCHALWCNNDQEVRLFNDQFYRWRQEQEARQTAEPAATGQAGQSPVQPEAPGASPQIEGSLEEPTSQSDSMEPPAPAATLQAGQPQPGGIVGPEIAGLQPPEYQPLELVGIRLRSFILSGDYFPITPRQLKQSWRYLRSLAREGPATELDVDATIEKVGRSGHLVEPVMRPPRLNQVELLLLIDRDGSMVPFEDLADTLVQTARMGGRLGRAGVYYFHNYPRGVLYQNKAFIHQSTIQQVLDRLPRERTVALIFSDAGAARGGLNSKRFDRTEVFLKQLQTGVRRVAWINPMPRTRWKYTTAGLIWDLVPMFECDRRGFDDAIDMLRGRLAVKVGKP